MSLIKTKFVRIIRAKNICRAIGEYLNDGVIHDRDVSEERMNCAVELYDRLVALELKEPHISAIKDIRVEAEIILNRAYNAMDWFYDGINPHDEVGSWA